MSSSQTPVNNLGTTFSHIELANRNLNWQEALDAMSSDMKFNVLRIGCYWSQIEPEQGKRDYTLLESVLDAVSAKGYKVLMNVGMKSPRWPEYYIPTWATPTTRKYGCVSDDTTLAGHVIDFLTDIVQQLKSYKCITHWHVENEPMDRAGSDSWYISKSFLQREVETVRNVDPTRPIMVNFWSEWQIISSAPWILNSYALDGAIQLGDAVGADVYPLVATWTSCQCVRTMNVPYRCIYSCRQQKKDPWITELQAEDWWPSVVTPTTVSSLMEIEYSQGFRSVLLWGFESWYQSLIQSNDSTMWNGMISLCNTYPVIN